MRKRGCLSALLLGALSACSGQPLPFVPPPPVDGGASDLARRLDLSAASDLAALPLTITPAAARIGIDHVVTLTASRPVSWSITSGNPGVLASPTPTSTLYVAPDEPGAAQVIATASDGAVAQATITIVPLELDVLAGTLGGAGNADDVGTDARFGYVQDFALTPDGTAIYVLDRSVGLRKVDVPTGRVTTLFSWGPSDVDGDATMGRLCSPQLLAMDQDRLLVFEDGDPDLLRGDPACGGRVRSIDMATESLSTLATLPEHAYTDEGWDRTFDLPSAAVTDGAGHVYLEYGYYSASAVQSIWRLDLASGASTSLPITDGNKQPLAFDGNALLLDQGALWVATYGGVAAQPLLWRVDLPTLVASPGPAVGTTPPGYWEWLGAEPGALYGAQVGPGFSDIVSYLVTPTQPSPPGAVQPLLPSLTEALPAPLPYAVRGARYPRLARGLGGGQLPFVSSRTGVEIDRVQDSFPVVFATPWVGLLQSPPYGRLGVTFFYPELVVATDDEVYLGDTTLWRVDRATGAATAVDLSAIGQTTVASLAWDGADTLFACYGASSSAQIARISRSTGVVTPNVWSLASGQTCANLVFDALGQELIMGLSSYDDSDGDTVESPLIGLDIATGAISVPPISNVNLAFAPLPSPYADVDPASIAKFVAAPGGALYATDGAEVVARNGDGRWSKLSGSAAYASRDLYAADDYGHLFFTAQATDGPFVIADSAIERLDVATGTVTLLAGQRGVRGVRAGPLPARLSKIGGLSLTPSGDLFLLSEDALLSITAAHD